MNSYPFTPFTRINTIFSLFLIFFVSSGCIPQNKPSRDFAEEREQMVNSQIKERGITDTRVVEAMMKVPRHLFVPEPYTSGAYDDTPLPIGYNQTISQPYIVAFMTEALQLKPTDHVLEIGTGSGYQAAILAEICDSVYTIDIIKQLTDGAGKILDQLGYKNIMIRHGDGYLGWPEHGPFNAIIVTCAATQVPQALQDQLAEGGRMIIPVGEQGVQELILMKKKNGRFRQESVLPVRFVPMINDKGKSY